jgi:sphingosine kinase
MSADDPFRDPSLAPTAAQPADGSIEHMDVPDTIAVGRNASLTLGTDSLIVLGIRTFPSPEDVR